MLCGLYPTDLPGIEGLEGTSSIRCHICNHFVANEDLFQHLHVQHKIESIVRPYVPSGNIYGLSLLCKKRRTSLQWDALISIDDKGLTSFRKWNFLITAEVLEERDCLLVSCLYISNGELQPNERIPDARLILKTDDREFAYWGPVSVLQKYSEWRERVQQLDGLHVSKNVMLGVLTGVSVWDQLVLKITVTIKVRK